MVQALANPSAFELFVVGTQSPRCCDRCLQPGQLHEAVAESEPYLVEWVESRGRVIIPALEVLPTVWVKGSHSGWGVETLGKASENDIWADI